MSPAPKKLQPYLDALIKLFHEHVTDFDNKFPPHHNQYHCWYGTYNIALAMDLPITRVRANLNKLEKLGFLASKRQTNYIFWRAIHIPGFEQHPNYKEYYQKKLSQ